MRFVVDTFNPLFGFMEVAYKDRRRRCPCIHFLWILELFKESAKSVGVVVTDDPPPRPTGGELHIYVPVATAL